MIPCNGQIEIEPEVNSNFVASVKGTYDEVGIIVAVPKGSDYEPGGSCSFLKPGVRVFFDSWQASKFPKDDKGGLYWYVPVEAIKAYEPLPEK